MHEWEGRLDSDSDFQEGIITPHCPVPPPSTTSLLDQAVTIERNVDF